MCFCVLFGCSKNSDNEERFGAENKSVEKMSGRKEIKELMNTPKAILSLKGLAEKGNPSAQNFLGAKYYNGEGVEKDLKKAAKWFRKAAEQGNVNSQFNLGLMHARGYGVLEDLESTRKWFQKAAIQGHGQAQNLLGAIYAFGQGVPVSKELGYAWWNIAAANGVGAAKEQKIKLVKLMTPEQKIKAQELSKEMVEENPKLIN